jgi:hypothetical protein
MAAASKGLLGRCLQALGVGVFGLSVLLLAYSDYLFTYDNTRSAPLLSSYRGAMETEAVSFVVAAVGGLIVAVGLVLARTGRSKSAAAPSLHVPTAVGAALVLVLGYLLAAVPLIYSLEGWQLWHSVSGLYFWDVAPEAFIGLGWVLGGIAVFLVIRRRVDIASSTG